MFLFCLGKFFHAFPRLAEFSQGQERRIPWEKTEAQYLNIKQVYKFSAESTKELKSILPSPVAPLNRSFAESTKELKSSVSGLFIKYLYCMAESTKELKFEYVMVMLSLGSSAESTKELK